MCNGASLQLNPEVAARHLVCQETQDTIISNSDRLITYEKAMGYLTSRQAENLKSALETRREELTFTDMITRQTVFRRDQMLYDIKLCMIRYRTKINSLFQVAASKPWVCCNQGQSPSCGRMVGQVT
jgi:hypothetical protein